LLLRNGRVTLRKLRNMLANGRAYRQRSLTSGSAPTVALLDASSHCNLHCITCRNSPTDLIDISGQSERGAELGNLEFPRFCRIVDDLQQDTLLATLYVTGEPLLNRHLEEMVRYASDRGLATMVSSNGMLLGEDLAERLLRAGVDYLKVAVSGFTQEVYGIYHRGGDIETVLENVARFERIRRRLGRRCLVVVDYILFEHNRLEEVAVRRFCRDHRLTFTRRYGRVFEESGISSPVESREHYRPKSAPCDWLWKIMTFRADGQAVPCCQFATCAESPFVMGVGGVERVTAIWNGEKYRELRRIQAVSGRGTLPLCKTCFYADIDFQS
jgi:MoaA/NifB/PqqE/SkfB family radical SAM enzyme